MLTVANSIGFIWPTVGAFKAMAFLKVIYGTKITVLAFLHTFIVVFLSLVMKWKFARISVHGSRRPRFPPWVLT